MGTVLPFPQKDAGGQQQQTGFTRFELNRIVDLYGRMVAAGLWKDYAIAFEPGAAAFWAFRRTAEPFRVFMLSQVRDDDLALFTKLSAKPPVARAQTPLTTLMPAFMISELRRAFEIGFLLLLPFLIIDLAVAAVLMAMGMMMLPPPTISLPMKIIFFVLVDGWALVAGSLVCQRACPVPSASALARLRRSNRTSMRSSWRVQTASVCSRSSGNRRSSKTPGSSSAPSATCTCARPPAWSNGRASRSN